MLDPTYLLHISEGAEDISEQLHTDIVNRVIERVMLRLDREEDYLLTSADKWRIQVLQDAGYLLEDIQAVIADKTKLQLEEIKEAMEEAGVKAINYDDKIYQSAGLSPASLEQSPSLVRIMQRNYDATVGEWNNFTRTMASATQQNFITALDKAYTLVSTGTVSYTEAVREAVNELIKNGADVIYANGRKDSIETATLRAVRTGISQMSGQIQIARMDELDVDLVLVSSHLGARPEHQIWQGKVYSRSGRSPKYPDFVQSTKYGSVTGLCGANCRHNFSPYFEGMGNPFDEYDSEANKKAYEEQQRQRELERRIRNTKREVIGFKTALENAKTDKSRLDFQMDYERKARLLKRQNEEYKAYCEEHNLKQLRDRVSIARWDRKQASMAREAARKKK